MDYQVEKEPSALPTWGRKRDDPYFGYNYNDDEKSIPTSENSESSLKMSKRCIDPIYEFSNPQKAGKYETRRFAGHRAGNMRYLVTGSHYREEKSRCSLAAVILATSLVFLIVLAAIGSIIYFLVFKKDPSDLGTASTEIYNSPFTTLSQVSNTEQLILEMEFTILSMHGEPTIFIKEYEDPESEQYKQLETTVIKMIDNIYMNSSEHKDYYNRTEVYGFRNGSVVSEFGSFFNPKSLSNSTDGDTNTKEFPNVNSLAETLNSGIAQLEDFETTSAEIVNVIFPSYLQSSTTSSKPPIIIETTEHLSTDRLTTTITPEEKRTTATKETTMTTSKQMTEEVTTVSAPSSASPISSSRPTTKVPWWTTVGNVEKEESTPMATKSHYSTLFSMLPTTDKVTPKQSVSTTTRADTTSKTVTTDICGTRPASGKSAKIVGGKEADEGNWPWQVALLQYGGQICGGTLVNEQYVVTAAHCVNSISSISSYSVLLGDISLSGSAPSSKQNRVVNTLSSITLHPLYNNSTYDNDFAVLGLSQRVNFTDYIRPACINDMQFSPGKICYITGWGFILSGGSTVDLMREAQVPLISNSECTLLHDQSPIPITDNMLCAGYPTGGKDTCQGDSGGPLVCELEESGVWHLVGVTSWGNGCGDANNPGVYSNISAGYDWIEAIINACPNGQFKCATGLCVDVLNVCDSTNDCTDWSDEIGCTCHLTQGYRCQNGPCIQRWNICDNKPECPEGDDESNCGTFYCENGNTVKMAFVCDGYNDCGDDTDEEQNCPCLENQFDCELPISEGNASHCITENYVCDGIENCPDGRDEVNCTCMSWQFECGNGSCIPSWEHCNREANCADGTDEENCNKCHPYEYVCNNYQCIPMYQRCNFNYECSDGSDELECPELDSNTENTYYPNSSLSPLNGSFEIDCGDNSNKTNCSKTSTDAYPATSNQYYWNTTTPIDHSLCGGIFNVSENHDVNITSSNYPSNYAINQNCIWLVTGPEESQLVVHFVDFSTENGFDSLSAGNGLDVTRGTVISYFSGSAMPPDFISSGNEMWIHFTSDASVTERGFWIEVSLRNLTDSCGEGYFRCSDGFCVVQNNVCNEKIDCPDGSDETGCFRLDSNGIVQVSFDNIWYPLCINDTLWNDEIGDYVCKKSKFRGLWKSELSTVQTADLEYATLISIDRVEVEISDLCGDFQVNLTCEEYQCGIRTAQLTNVANGNSKIVGGDDVEPGMWPWQVSLQFFGSHFCGGTLISNQFVLTAAHCVASIPQPDIVLGVTRLSDYFSEFRVERHTNQSYIHKNYSLPDLNYDLALVKLDGPVTFSDYIVPACLPPDDFEFLDGAYAWSTGWGSLADGGVSPDHLQEVRIPVIAQEDCDFLFGDYGYYDLSPTDQTICTGYEEGGQGTCHGDSGGPLSYQMDDGKWYVTGATSYGYKCAAKRSPSVFAKLTSMLDFVRKTMEENN